MGLYLAGFRVLTPGAYLVHHDPRSDSVDRTFATVIGLVAWIYLPAETTVYAAEVDVVLARRLWPRAIVQPPLTEADRASMALQALQNQRRPEQHVDITFTDRSAGTRTAPRAPVRQAMSGRRPGPTTRRSVVQRRPAASHHCRDSQA
jgi:hypothetical protein